MVRSKRIVVSAVSAALLSLGLAQAATAQVPVTCGGQFRGKLRPAKDQDRCLARITGGFGLAPCSDSPRTNVVLNQGTLGGRLAFGAECVAVQLPVSQDPWLSGTRLQAVQCSTLAPAGKVPDRGLWRCEGTADGKSVRIKAARPPVGTEKCLSLVENPGSLRAVILDCKEFGVTEFQPILSPG